MCFPSFRISLWEEYGRVGSLNVDDRSIKSYTKNLMEHLGKHDHKDIHDKRNTTSEGLAHKVSEQNKDCIEIGLDSTS